MFAPALLPSEFTWTVLPQQPKPGVHGPHARTSSNTARALSGLTGEPRPVRERCEPMPAWPNDGFTPSGSRILAVVVSPRPSVAEKYSQVRRQPSCGSLSVICRNRESPS